MALRNTVFCKTFSHLLSVLTVSAALSTTFAAHSAAAEQLSDAEIRGLLAGNSVTWNHQGLTQQQYFSETGFTVYQDAAGNHETGVWSVTNDGLFCSNWQNRGWLCYELTVENTNQLLWNGPVNTGFEDTEKVVHVSRLQRGNKTNYFLEEDQEEAVVISYASQLLGGSDNLGGIIPDDISLSTSEEEVADISDQYQSGYYYYQ